MEPTSHNTISTALPNANIDNTLLADDDLAPPSPTASSLDEAYASSTTSSSTYATTISSYIRSGIEENGRRYASYGKHAYGLPIDEREQERNDLQHAKFNLVIGDRLHSAPLGFSTAGGSDKDTDADTENGNNRRPTTTSTPLDKDDGNKKDGAKILDLGTGSGIWAIEMGDTYPNASIVGVDIAPVQSTRVPPNVCFEVLDIEDPEWLFRKESFDFIHARELLLSVRDWGKLFGQMFAHAKPGGWVEVSASYPTPKSDDGSLKPDASMLEMQRMFFEMGEKMGTEVDAPLRFKAGLKAAGFVDVVENVFKIPQGPWPKDKRLKKIGAFENYSLTMGLEAYMMRGYTSVMGGEPEELRVRLMKTYEELRDPGLHTYVF